MNTVCWRVIATVDGCITINKIVFSNVINKRTYFTREIYLIDNLFANPNQKNQKDIEWSFLELEISNNL